MAELSKREKWDLVRGTNLQTEDRFCLVTLFLFQGDGDAAFCKQETIADEMGLNARSVRRALKRLDDAGVICRNWVNRSGVPYRVYCIDFEALRRIQRDTHGRTPVSDREPTVGHERPAHGRTPASATVGHERPLRSDTSVLHEHPRTSNGTSTLMGDSESPTFDTSEKSPTDGFGRFYDAYAKKKNPERARAAFSKAVKKKAAKEKTSQADAAEFIIARATAFAATWGNPKDQFKPHPASWLNAGGYDDDPETWEQNGRAGTVGTAPETERAWQSLLDSLRRHSRFSPDAIEREAGAAAWQAAKSIGLKKIDEANDFDRRQLKTRFCELLNRKPQ